MVGPHPAGGQKGTTEGILDYDPGRERKPRKKLKGGRERSEPLNIRKPSLKKPESKQGALLVCVKKEEVI